MTSSTVSITANPSGSSLRRPTLTGDKNSADGIDPASSGKDLSNNSVRTGNETVLRSKETVETKNPNTTNSKLRKRTVVKKSNPKPVWKTAVSVICKNLGVLVILLVLGQMIRRLGFGGYNGSGLVGDAGLDYERRIAEVEKFLKTTTKMMQVQVEVVDRKIDNEIAGLKKEVSKRIDDERVGFVKKVGILDGRVEEMERGFGSLLSRDEFDEFLKGFKGVGDVGESKRLDEIRAFAKEIVEKEIEKHAADGLGMVDYAVASGGGSVVKHSEAFVSTSRVGSWFSGNNVRSDALKILQPSFGQPGECFPLKGDNGYVEIKLRSAIVPEAITLEHVSKSVAFDRSSAPKDCRVLGWLRNEEDTREERLLTGFMYDLEKSSAQTFNVDSNAAIIDSIRLEFLSNHGSATHTCIYRVRVHGHEPSA